MDKHIFTLQPFPHPSRARVKDAINLAPDGYQVVIQPPKRTLEQNSLLWALLGDIAEQCDLCINGMIVKASPDDWKDVFTAALHKSQRMASGIDGGVVFLGSRTSRMNKREFSDLCELILAYGAEHGVAWSE